MLTHVPVLSLLNRCVLNNLQVIHIITNINLNKIAFFICYETVFETMFKLDK
jgi:hypothetical protein